MTPQNEIGPPSSSEQIQVRPEASTSADAPNAQQDPLVQCTHILDVPLKIEALLDCLTMDLRAVAAVKVGTVILLNRSAGDNVDLYVNGVPLASGEIMAIENTAGVQITDFVHVEHSGHLEL